MGNTYRGVIALTANLEHSNFCNCPSCRAYDLMVNLQHRDQTLDIARTEMEGMFRAFDVWFARKYRPRTLALNSPN